MFLEDVLLILFFARLLIIIMLSRRGEEERQRGQQVTGLLDVTWHCGLRKTRSSIPRGDICLFVEHDKDEHSLNKQIQHTNRWGALFLLYYQWN